MASMPKLLSFSPCPLIKNNHQQTFVGSFVRFPIFLFSETIKIPLPDGDFLAVEVSTPKKWLSVDPTVFSIHGLCGSHKSPYLLRLTKKLHQKNIRSVRINLRGCGSGKGLAKKGYHGGQSGDIVEVLKYFKTLTPLSSFLLLGVSLGGNISLKLAGENPCLAQDLLSAVIAINPPVDIYAGVQKFSQKENAIYSRYFMYHLREEIYYRYLTFPDLPKTPMPTLVSFQEFDDLYTAPTFGFKNSLDYYEKCSAKHFIPNITLPCHILFSEDDPLIPPSSFDKLIVPDNINLCYTNQGGHVGYLGHPQKPGGFYWMDGLILEWISSSKL
jgi:hypothetical protein